MQSLVIPFGHLRGAINGLLEIPEGSAKSTIIIVPGSGPIDRDGNLSATRELKNSTYPFREWSSELVANGYSVFRFDKRVVAHKESYLAGSMECEGIEDEYLDDISDAISELLRSRKTGNAPIVLLGHSLGGVAALVCASFEPHVSSVITVGCPVHDLVTTLQCQLSQSLSDDDLVKASDAINSVMSGSSEDKLLGLSATYWRSYSGLSLQHLVLQVPNSIKILLVHGQMDPLVPIEVFSACIEKLGVSPQLTSMVILGADHELMVHAAQAAADKILYQVQPIIEWLDDGYAQRR